MSEVEEKEVLLDIPKLNWPSWETLVAAALDGIAGVVSYEIKAMRREARVKFDANQIDENQLMDNLKKKTRYRSMSIKNTWNLFAADNNGNNFGAH